MSTIKTTLTVFLISTSAALAGGITDVGPKEPLIIEAEPLACVIYTKTINHITGRLLRPDCEWREHRKPKKKEPPMQRPEPEMCRTEIKGEIVYVNCGERK